MKRLFVVCVSLLAIFISTGCVEELENISDTVNENNETLVLEDGHKGYADEYGFSYYIEGYVKNNSNKEYSYVQLTFSTYDAEGNTLGSCLANNSGLEANGRWKFQAICTGEANEVATYKLTDITKW